MCVRLCLNRSLELAKLLPQPSYVHLYGFSPEKYKYTETCINQKCYKSDSYLKQTCFWEIAISHRKKLYKVAN